MDEHKLFVGNMAARITQRDLWRFFSPYGLIDECAKFHESYAFVRFVHADDAQRARLHTHGAILKGRKLKVEFAATENKTDSSTSLDHHQRYLFIQPLRRTVNMPPCNCQPISTPKLSGNAHLPIGSSRNVEFLTPDLLRLAGIQYSSPDDGYETTLSPNLNTSSDSRFFPLSATRSSTFSGTSTSHIDRSNEDLPLLSWDFTRIRLFSDGSSGFGDDSNLYIE